MDTIFFMLYTKNIQQQSCQEGVVIMLIKFTKKQLEVMKILWNSDSPMIASDIVQSNPELNINTVQACLRGLLKINAIKVADIVYSGTVLTRSYAPAISSEEYFGRFYKDITKNRSSMLVSLIDTETSLDELERLEKLIEQKKAEFEKKE